MSTKMGKLCKKSVLVSVYVEKPTKRKVSSKNNHHHHHHHHHHYYIHHNLKQEVTTNKGSGSTDGKGYSRRSQLLLYSQRLRESADHRPVHPISKPISSNILQSTQNVAAVQRKPKYEKTTPCLGNWKILNFKFCRSLTSVQIKKDRKKKKRPAGSTSNAVKTIMKNLQVQKKRGFIAKFGSMLQKSR